MLQVSDNMLDAKNLIFTVQGEEFLSFAASIKKAEHSIAPSAWENFTLDEMIL